MKASELIQKLLELTQEAGKDLEVVYDYKRGAWDAYESYNRQPEFDFITENDVKIDCESFDYNGNWEGEIIRIGDDW